MNARVSVAILLGVACGVAAIYGLSRDRAGPGIATSDPPPVTSGATAEVTVTDGRASVPNNPALLQRDSRSNSAKRPSAESVVFAGGSIRVDSANAVMAGDAFGPFLERLEREGASDLEARDLTKAYGDSLKVAVEQSGVDLELSKLVCGLSVCGADLRSPTEDQARFNSIMNSGQNSGTRVYSAVTTIVPNQDGTFSYRIIFSTDPAGTSLAVPRLPGPAGRSKPKT